MDMASSREQRLASLSASSALLASISAATLAMSSRILPTVPSPQMHALHGQAQMQPPPLQQQQQQQQQPRRASQSLSYNAGRFSAGLASAGAGGSSSSSSAQHTQFNLNSIDSMVSHSHDLSSSAPHMQMWLGGHTSAPVEHHASHQYASRAGAASHSAVSHHAHASASAPPELLGTNPSLTNRRIASRNSGAASMAANPLTGGMGMNGSHALERAPSPANNMCEERIPLYFRPLSLIIHSLATYLYHTHNIMTGIQTFIALHMIRSSTRALAVDSIKRLYAVLLNRYFRVFLQLCHSIRTA